MTGWMKKALGLMMALTLTLPVFALAEAPDGIDIAGFDGESLPVDEAYGEDETEYDLSEVDEDYRVEAGEVFDEGFDDCEYVEEELVEPFFAANGDTPPEGSVSGVKLNLSEMNMTYNGDTGVLTATVEPETATDQTVTWSSDNVSVATVSAEGIVTPVGAGEATITVTATNGTSDTSDDQTATCIVTVSKADPVTTAPTALNATYGDTLADLTLPDGWTWKEDEETEVGNAGDQTFTATFVPEDKVNYNTLEVSVTVKVAKADPTVIAPTANKLSYSGQALALVEAGTTNGGTLQYSLDGKTYAEAIPTATDAGNYTVYYKVVGDANYNDVDAATVQPFIAKIDATGTAPKAVKLSYNGKAQALAEAGQTDDGKMQYSLDGTSYQDAIPTATNVGTYMVYYKVAGDKNHNDVTLGNIKSEIVKSDPTVTAPTGKQLPYNGKAQALAEAGEVDGGKMEYSLDGETYSAAMPTATDAGDYTVYYRVTGDDNHNSVAIIKMKAAITKIDPTVTAPKAKTLTYTAAAQALVEAGKTDGGKLEYSLDDKIYGDTVPTATNAGSYTVYYKVVGDNNYNDVKAASVQVEISKAPLTVTAEAKTKRDGTEDPDLTYTASGLLGSDVISGALERAEGEKVGEYAISRGSLTAGKNYDMKFTGAVLTITARPAASGTLVATMVASGDTGLNLTWTKVDGVDGYDVFFKDCDGKGSFPVVASLQSTDAASYAFTGLKKNVSYKAYVRAWMTSGGSKQYVLASSPEVHAFTANGTKKITNPGKLTVKKTAMTVKLGKAATIKATVKGIKKGKLKNHVAKLRYFSTNTAVATVSKSGKVKAMGAGSCTIYVLTTNGIFRTVTVTVDMNPTKIALKKGTKTVKVNATLDIGARVKLTPAKAITTLTWKSSRPQVATVDEKGVVTAHKKGNTTITVTTSNGKKAKIILTIK